MQDNGQGSQQRGIYQPANRPYQSNGQYNPTNTYQNQQKNSWGGGESRTNQYPQSFSNPERGFRTQNQNYTQPPQNQPITRGVGYNQRAQISGGYYNQGTSRGEGQNYGHGIPYNQWDLPMYHGERNSSKPKSGYSTRCSRCNRQNQCRPGQCPAQAPDKVCNGCGRPGHFVAMCRNTQQ